jgi:hypothetical protein
MLTSGATDTYYTAACFRTRTLRPPRAIGVVMNPRGEFAFALSVEARQREKVVTPFAMRPRAYVGRVRVDHADERRSFERVIADIHQGVRSNQFDYLGDRVSTLSL